MPRVKGGPRARKRHKKVLKKAKGYRMTRSKLFKRANEAVMRAGEHAFHGRKEKKRDFRKLWIQRITAALDGTGLNYSRFINLLKKKNITLNRKMLSQLAIIDLEGFSSVVEEVQK
ncbi:50S ribosomal protein L20 [candidate division WWE3 bacterium]|nr:50S ribosomal protein L20 [candidate division WWE3 bacterium]